MACGALSVLRPSWLALFIGILDFVRPTVGGKTTLDAKKSEFQNCVSGLKRHLSGSKNSAEFESMLGLSINRIVTPQERCKVETLIFTKTHP